MLEFEQKGGFAAILREIFNPSDESMELDSVYQLKNLCKSFYQKKMHLAKNLLETLDVMTNERP